MLGLSPFLALLLCFSVTPVLSTSLADPDVNSKDFETDHIQHTNPSQLHRRQAQCNPLPHQNLIWADCIEAALAMPRSQEGVHYHYPDENEPGDPSIPIIHFPLTSGGDPASAYNLPRSWSHNGCMVSAKLEPGLTSADVSFSSIRYQATMLVNLCVGGGNFLMPGPAPHPGQGGNETYKGVMIGVTRS